MQRMAASGSHPTSAVALIRIANANLSFDMGGTIVPLGGTCTAICATKVSFAFSQLTVVLTCWLLGVSIAAGLIRKCPTLHHGLYRTC
jgi:hypothetical protein